MCNEYQARIKLDDYVDRFKSIGIPFQWAGALPNRPLDDPIKPTDRATILRPLDPAAPAAGVEGLDLRWWMIPAFHRGAIKDWKSMCTNARLETVDTAPTFREAYKRWRCLVPLTGFIEYATPVRWRKGQPKTRLEIGWPDGDVRYFAGLWERSTPSDMLDGMESFAFVTGPASPDLEPFHDRTPPVLTLEQGLDWLRLDGPGKAMLEPLPPAGSFVVQERPRDAEPLSAELRRLV